MRIRAKQTSKTIRFIIPGLLDPVPYLDQLPAQELPELPVLSKMLSRGELLIPEVIDNHQDNFYSCLLEEITKTKNPGSSNEQPSIAGLSYLLDSDHLTTSENSEKKWIMRADPSFMVADRDQLVLANTGSLGISLYEAKSLVDEINQFFDSYEEENFWTLKCVTSERWYIISDKPINIQSIPPENALGQSIKSFLFSHDVSNQTMTNEQLLKQKVNKYWLNLFNEMQMILHQSPINKKRIAEKKLPVNSLWFWGAGKIIDDFSSLRKDVTLYSDHPFVQNLNYTLYGKNFSVPEYLSGVSSSEIMNHSSIITIESFIQAIRSKDIFSWVGLLEQFENNYLVPLIDNIKSGKISQVEIISPSGIKLLLTKKILKRWWKKNKNYRSFLCASSNF